MTPEEKQVILQKAKQFFKDKIVQSHKKNTQKLKKLSKFKPNPFLAKYLANFVFGNDNSKSPNISPCLRNINQYNFWHSNAGIL